LKKVNSYLTLPITREIIVLRGEYMKHNKGVNNMNITTITEDMEFVVYVERIEALIQSALDEPSLRVISNEFNWVDDACKTRELNMNDVYGDLVILTELTNDSSLI